MNWPLFKNIALEPLLVSALLTFIAVPAVIQIAKYFNLVDDPSKRAHPAHTESRIIPRAGGLAIFFGLVLAVSIFVPFAKGITGILLGAGLLVGVGLIDDYRDVHPYVRFGVNILAAILAVAGGAGLGFITNPFTGGVLHFDTIRWSFDFLGQHSILPIADLLAILWIAWTMNMVGWSGGVDGQMPGFVTIAALVIGYLSFTQISIENFPAWTGTTLSFIAAGSYLGFLFWNWYPQKIMPGYGGKSLAGYLLATIALLNTAKFGTAILVLGIPTIDAVYVLVTRLISRHNPTQAGRSHLHHKLLDAGWGKRRIALFYWIVSGILGLVALTVNPKQKFFTVGLVALIFIMLITWLKLSTIFLRKSDQDNG